MRSWRTVCGSSVGEGEAFGIKDRSFLSWNREIASAIELDVPNMCLNDTVYPKVAA